MSQIYFLILLLLIYPCFLVTQPVWTVYPANVMYSGQYQAILTSKTAGTTFTNTQTMYRADILPANYFTSPPNLILSLLGYKQTAPPDGNTFVGFDAKILASRTSSFDVTHTIYGASIAYLNYMYLALVQSNTDYFLGEYNQVFDTTVTNKTYLIDVGYNVGQTYTNYQTNKIQMKGFLAGYKMKQGTANGVYLNFTLKPRNSSYFSIEVAIHNNAILQKIWYYRIGYDRTSIQLKTYNDIFRDFYYELVNNQNTANIYNASWATATQFQYRNYLMGTNKINIAGTAPMAVQFFLYYYFAQSLAKVDKVYPLYIDNPAIAKYLYGETFYHVYKNCATSPDLYYLPSDRKCYSACPTLGYALDSASSTCFACHFTCRSCSVGNMANKCLSCDNNYRFLDSSQNKCNCPPQKYDDGVSLSCPSCHATCLSCVSFENTSCKSCDSSLKRELNDPDSNSIGDCTCILTYYEDSNTGTCKNCSTGCLRCSYSGTNEICSSCNSTANLQLMNNSCQCINQYQMMNQTCVLQKCGDGILTKSEECDDNNILNGDGCSNICKVQPQHVCIINKNISDYSICYFNGTISMTITDVSKSAYSNQVSLNLKIQTTANSQFLKNYLTESPYITIQDVTRRLQQIPQKDEHLKILRKRILASSNLKIDSIRFDQNTRMLYVTFSYSQNFDIRTKKIRFQPSMNVSNSQVKYFFNSPEAIIQLQKAYNKIDTKYYDQTEYKKAISLKYAFLALIAGFWIISLIFILIGKGNVAMEMMIVLQLAYISLLSQQKLEIMLGGLSQFGKYTAGYNIELFPKEGKCINFVAIQMSCSLVNNLNISLILMILIVLIYWSFKLINRILNNKAQKQFIQRRNQRYMIRNNEKTNENIIPNMQNVSDLQLSQSSQAIQENYYKQKQFIPARVYNLLLDLEYFLAFITVMVWVLSMCFIKQDTISSFVQAAFFCILYLLLWIFWFVKYTSSNFSFCQAHKQNQTKYHEESQMSQNNGENQINLKQNVPQQKQKKPRVIQKRKFSSIIFKLLFYPAIWLFLLIISVVLGLTQSIGYVCEALIITGSIIMSFVIWFSKMYKQKMHILRSILNCAALCIIEICYIISQVDSIVQSGLPIALIVYIVLSLTLISNATSTFYLYSLEIKLTKKNEESREVQNIQNEINRLQQLKRQKQRQNQQMGLYFKANQKPNSNLSNSYYQQTIKKDFNQNNYQIRQPQMMPQNDFSTTTKYKMSKQQINQIFSQNKLQKSQSFSTKVGIDNRPFSSYQIQNPGQSRNEFITQKKKLFYETPILSRAFSPQKIQNRNRSHFSIDQSNIKLDLSNKKY